MEKLYKYLLKIGVEEKPRRGNYTPAPAEFYRQTYGDEYFYNAPNHTHAGAVVALDYNAEAPAEYFKNLMQIEKSLQTYCKKYGYCCRRDTCHYSKTVYFYIEKQTDRDAATDFYYFRDAARQDCEHYYHIAKYHGTPQKEIETTLRAIMDKYGDGYKEFLQATQPATA